MASRRSHAPTNFFRQEDNIFRHEDKKTGFLLMAYKRVCNNILAARASKQRGSAKRDLPSETHCKLRSSAAVGTDNHPTTTVPRSGTDISTMILRTVHRSRFAEPKECVSVLPTAALLRSLQWVSDRYVSHRDTALLILSYSNGGRQTPKHRTTKEPQPAEQT